jgi:polo-like kinase 1
MRFSLVQLQAEIKIHRTLKHKNICLYKHYFEDRNNCYILLELCTNQSMNEMIKRRKRVTEPEAAYFMTQLLEATRYMHDNSVIHRDLKLGNLFLDKNMVVKVGDLGLATRVEDRDEKRKTICGTPNYIAPEIIQGDKSKRGHSFEVDIWSIGVILYTVLVGKPPYEAKDVKATYQRILANEYSFPAHTPLSDNVKDLIRSMLKTDPTERPSLDFIEAHAFLVSNRVPASLPNSVLHRTPVWQTNEFGALVTEEELVHVHVQQPLSKSLLPPSTSTTRQPFSTRHPNMLKKHAMPPTKKDKPERETTLDLQRVVKTAMSMATSAAKKTVGSPAFQIFDESKTSDTQSEIGSTRSATTMQSRATLLSEETIVTRTKALSLGSTTSPANAPSPSESQGNAEKDNDILRNIVDQLDTVFTIAQSRKGSYRAYAPQPLSSRHGPNKWVTRYVDYTSKYGLGFLLNDGGSGVYFNDSTKTALEAHGDSFQYIERKKDEKDDTDRRPECTVKTYTLSSYPESLKKKVTLLTHFRNYLIEQQKKAAEEEGEEPVPYGDSDDFGDLIFVKKWIQTKHAILFRLSNHTIQVVFYDQTEVLLTPDTRYVTYVDKNRLRSTYSLTDELVGTSTELEKRLKYTKEIISQLMSGQRS